MTGGIPYDPSSPAVASALEENWLDYLRAFGRARHVYLRDDPELFLFITGIPSGEYNAVMRANLPPASADATIKQVRRRFAAADVPWGWLIGPGSRPPDLAQRLERHGLQRVATATAMLADLEAMPAEASLPAGLAIRAVADEAMLERWIEAERIGFESSDAVASGLAAIRRGMGVGNLADGAPFRHYLGLLDGEPVATASLHIASGVAGIYDVSTAPWARRRGIGRAMTAGAMRDARDLAYRMAILQSSDMGLGVYRGLGFRECCAFAVYA